MLNIVHDYANCYKEGLEMVIVERHINGITINTLEYLLGADGEVMEFIVNQVDHEAKVL